MGLVAVTALGACGSNPPAKAPAKAPANERPYTPANDGSSFHPPRHLHPPE